MKNNRRDESVIFSMQTFVVKLASGVAALAASIVIQIFQNQESGNGRSTDGNRTGFQAGTSDVYDDHSDSCIADRITCVPKTLHINR